MKSWALACLAASITCFFGGGPAAIADVVQDRFVEQLGLLGDQGDPAAKIGHRHLFQRHAVDRDFALLRIEEAAEQIRERAFSAAVGTDDRQSFAERDRQIDVAQHVMRAVVAEADVAKLQLMVRRGDLLRIAPGSTIFDCMSNSG